MEYIVKFVVDTDDGVTEDKHKSDALYVAKWFDKLSKIVRESDDDLMINIDPYVMRLYSVELGSIFDKPNK